MNEKTTNLGRRNFFEMIKSNGIFAILVLFAAVFIFGSLTVSYFFKPNFWMGILKTYAPTTIMAIGLGAVIIGGNTDISCGSTASLCCVLSVYCFVKFQFSIFACCIVAILCGTICGAIKGAFITYVRLNPLLLTFAFSWIAEGLGLWLVPDSASFGAALPISKFYASKVIGIPVPLWLIIIALIIWYVIRNTSLGIHIYAMGNDFGRAFATGINYQRTRMMSWIFCGFMSGLAGFAICGLIATATYNYGSAQNIQAVASCVVGGITLGGGAGTILGAATGSIFFGMLSQTVLALVKNIYAQSLINYSLVFLCIVGPSFVKTFKDRRR